MNASTDLDGPSAASRQSRFGDVRTRLAFVLVAPVVAFGLIRPLIGSDSAALAIAGVIPLTYNLVLAVWRRRIDLLAVLSAVSFSLGCLVSLLVGGSALPLKLHDAAITFVIGLILLIAVMLRRPIPIGRFLNIGPGNHLDHSLGALIGGFLMLHALLHLALAILLPTHSYVVVSRVVDWGTLGLGALALRGYLRRVRHGPSDVVTRTAT